MENMSLQKTEIKKFQDQVSDLQDQIKRKYSTHTIELQISKKLTESFQKSLQESSIGNMIGRVKEII